MDGFISRHIMKFWGFLVFLILCILVLSTYLVVKTGAALVPAILCMFLAYISGLSTVITYNVAKQ